MHQRLLPVCEEDAVGDIWTCINTECCYYHVPVNGRLHPKEYPMTAHMLRDTIKGTPCEGMYTNVNIVLRGEKATECQAVTAVKEPFTSKIL